MIDFESFSERMYRAAISPELWKDILADLTISTDSDAGILQFCWPETRDVYDSNRHNSVHFQREIEKAKKKFDYSCNHKLINRGFFQFTPAVSDGADLFDVDLAPREGDFIDVCSRIVSMVELPNNEVIRIEFLKSISGGNYDDDVLQELNKTYKSFYCAVRFAPQIQFEKTRSNILALAEVGVPAALIGCNGRLLCCNAHFERLRGRFFNLSAEKLSLIGGDAMRKAFASSLELASKEGVNLNIPATQARSPAVLRMMPAHREEPFFAFSGTILIISPVATSANIPPFEMVSELFGLTPAESRLAVALTSGLSLRDSAASQRITVGTARSYLVRIFAKTGTSQQSGLVSLIKGIGSVWGGTAV